MRPTADLVTFNEEIFNIRLHFLCIAGGYWSCSSGDAKFGSHRYCDSKDMLFACHVIQQDQVIKGL